MASYAATKAGALAELEHKYRSARSYYLAFFAMVQVDDPLWEQMNGLVNPMLNYYWISLARELNVTFMRPPTPALTAVQVATHANAGVQQAWREATAELARVNPRFLRRVADQIRLERKGSPEALQVADQIEAIVKENAP
jgi:hypothetical protein